MLADTTEKGATLHSSNWGEQRNWVASLSLGFKSKGNKTILDTMRFSGPLRVQRAFYPEGDTCHCYILHPPGGMVSGDRLSMQINTAPGSHALITTPSAGKVYGTDSHDLAQQQTVNLTAVNSVLEYLPQETIIFDSAKAQLHTLVQLSKDSKAIVWDMVVLGRQAGDAPFDEGSLEQTLRIEIDGSPLHTEHLQLPANSSLRASPAGLMGYDCFGAIYVVCEHPELAIDLLRETLQAHERHVNVAVTHKPGLLIIRAMSHSAEKLRECFVSAWQTVRPVVLEKEASSPRIWFT